MSCTHIKGVPKPTVCECVMLMGFLQRNLHVASLPCYHTSHDLASWFFVGARWILVFRKPFCVGCVLCVCGQSQRQRCEAKTSFARFNARVTFNHCKTLPLIGTWRCTLARRAEDGNKARCRAREQDGGSAGELQEPPAAHAPQTMGWYTRDGLARQRRREAGDYAPSPCPSIRPALGLPQQRRVAHSNPLPHTKTTRPFDAHYVGTAGRSEALQLLRRDGRVGLH